MKTFEEILRDTKVTRATFYAHDYINESDSIKSAYKRYCRVFENAERIQDIQKRIKVLQSLLYTMIDEYRPTSFDRYVHDLAYEFSLYPEYKKEDPPYSSIEATNTKSSIEFYQAKILLLYHEVKEALLGDCSLESAPKIDSCYEATSNSSKSIKLIKINKIDGLGKPERLETYEGYNNSLNCRLREYKKHIDRFLTIESAQERATSLESLLKMIEQECNPFICDNAKQEWTYKMIHGNGIDTIEEAITGPPDYEVYKMTYYNQEERRKMAAILNQEPYKSMGVVFAELEIHTLHTSLKTEISRSKIESNCFDTSEDKTRKGRKGVKQDVSINIFTGDKVGKKTEIREQHINVVDHDNKEKTETSKNKSTKNKGGRPKRAGKTINKAFIYDAGGETNPRLQLFYQGLCALGWIKENTEVKSFLSIFYGKETTYRIIWTGETNVLTELFRELVIRKKIVALPEGESIWMMVNARFWNHEGNKEFGNMKLGSTRAPIDQKDNIDSLVNTLNPETNLDEVRESLQSQ